MLDEFYEKHSYPIPLTLGPNELDGVGLGHRRPVADCGHHRFDARVLLIKLTRICHPFTGLHEARDGVCHSYESVGDRRHRKAQGSCCRSKAARRADSGAIGPFCQRRRCCTRPSQPTETISDRLLVSCALHFGYRRFIHKIAHHFRNNCRRCGRAILVRQPVRR